MPAKLPIGAPIAGMARSYGPMPFSLREKVARSAG